MSRSTTTKILATALLGALSASRIGAQTVRGIVLDRANLPVSGVVVQLLDSASGLAARALSNDRGEFRVVASRPGTYRLRTLRIGYRPVTSEPLALRSGEEAVRQLVLSNILVALDTVRVNDKSSCRAFTDSGAATFAVWEQVRAALTATQLTANERVIAATTVAYERSLDPMGRRVLRQTLNVSSDYVKQPWRTIAPDQLRRDGFVVTTRDNTMVYYAPGLDMLLSPGFVEDHCFRLTTDRNRLGIAFEPTPERKRVPEIRGTLWLERKSAELQSLEYRYANIPSEQADEARGDMEFVRLKNGGWAITKWAIRMPMLENRIASQAFGGAGLRLTGIQVSGGELALVRRAGDTLWSRPAVMMAGVVMDSLSQQPVAGATIDLSGTTLHAVADARGRFTISNVLPGEYTAEVHTPSLDSASAVYQAPVTFADASSHIELRVPTATQLQATVCGTKKLDFPGIVLGTVEVLNDTAIAPSVRVTAEWPEITARNDGAGFASSTQLRRLETRADPHGVFRLCGVPVSTRLSISATSNGVTAGPVNARIQAPSRFARASLVLNHLAPANSVLAGTVLIDSTQQPIAGVEVTLTELAKATRTNERGGFRFTDVATGKYSLTARHPGFSAFEGHVTVDSAHSSDLKIHLSRVVALDSVVVEAKETTNPWLREFEDNRKLGLGQFFARADLEKRRSSRLEDLLADLRGTVIIRGSNTNAYLATKRLVNFCPPRDVKCMRAEGLVYLPDEGMSGHPGAVTACYAQVWLDDHLMNREHPAEPFELATITPSQIEAMEYYDGVTATPAKYSRRGSECGVLVIHTRRSP